MYSTNLEDYLGCRALWIAVLVQGIKDIDDFDKSLARQAKDWVFSSDISQPSFIWICSMLDIPAEELLTRCITRHGRITLLGGSYIQNIDRRGS
jgi:hypothetical protein